MTINLNGCACAMDFGPRRPFDYLSLDLDDSLAEDKAVFLASNDDGQPVGFIEVGLRSFRRGL